jgi:hypothetical protein
MRKFSVCAAYMANQAWRKKRIVVVGAGRGAIERVVIGILQADAGIEPWPARRFAGAERNVGKLRDPAIAVRAEAASQAPEEGRIRGPADIEILSGEHKPAVATIGERGLQPQ